MKTSARDSPVLNIRKDISTCAFMIWIVNGSEVPRSRLFAEPGLQYPAIVRLVAHGPSTTEPNFNSVVCALLLQDTVTPRAVTDLCAGSRKKLNLRLALCTAL